MKIKLIYPTKTIPKMQFQPILRCRDALLNKGVEIINRDEDGDFDIVLVGCWLMGESSLDEIIKRFGLEGKPVVLFDSQDSPKLGHFHLTKRSDVVGYVKKQVFKDRLMHDVEYINDRYHFHLLVSSEKKEKKKDGDMSKLIVGWNLGMSDMFKAFSGELLPYEKILDVHSSGTIHYNHNPHYIRHRSICHQKLREMTARRGWSFSGRCSGGEYKEKMRQSKIGVSPWGLGEICFRNFEMIRTGTIIIAPETKHLETWPDIFKPHENYIPCSPDFSDLEKKIEMLLGDYDNYKKVAESAFSLMKKCWEAETFADYFVNLLNQIKGIQV